MVECYSGGDEFAFGGFEYDSAGDGAGDRNWVIWRFGDLVIRPGKGNPIRGLNRDRIFRDSSW
jgi:hypothetical protein